MSIKFCVKRVAIRCYRTQTIQPFSCSTSIGWVCPECAKQIDLSKADTRKAFKDKLMGDNDERDSKRLRRSS